MSQRFKKIVLVTDVLSSSRSATASTFYLAKKHDASLTIIDTLREPSNFSRWLSSNAGDVFEMVLADKQKRLESLANQFINKGVNANSKVFFGKTSEAITQAAVECEADLVVRQMKGFRSQFPGVFGNTSRNLMRICPCPVLFTGENSIDDPKVLACVNAEHDAAENEAILRVAEQVAASDDKLAAVYCWKLYGKEMMQGHMPDEAMQKLLSESEQIHQKHFDKSLEEIEIGKFEGKFRMVNGDPRIVISKLCRNETIDVVVMCSASLNHRLKRLLGSTIESVLNELPCSLLVVKPEGFKSPFESSKATIKSTN